MNGLGESTYFLLVLAKAAWLTCPTSPGHQNRWSATGLRLQPSAAVQGWDGNSGDQKGNQAIANFPLLSFAWVVGMQQYSAPPPSHQTCDMVPDVPVFPDKRGAGGWTEPNSPPPVI